jgi:4-amino-4-deoxy-L-arabinose transferase-like glycosyltransferase
MGRLRNWVADNRAAAIVLVVYAVLATAYNLADPLFEPPDELLHYDFVQFLQRQGRLPVVDLAGPETEYHQPPLYYALAALTTPSLGQEELESHTLRNPFWGYEIGAVGRDNKNQYLLGPGQAFPFDDATRAVHLTRALSTLFGCGTVLLAYLLARRFLSKSLAVASMTVVAFTPNFLLTSGAVTNDSLVILISAMAGWIIVNLNARTSPPRLGVWIGLGVLLGLGLLTKLSAWTLLPVAALAVTLLALRLRSWRVWLTAGAVLIACVALLGGWWIVRNLWLYGDPSGLDSMWAVWGIRRTPTWRTYLNELDHFRTTFWANFGYGNIPLPGWVYSIADVFVVGGVVGLLVTLFRRRDRLRQAVLLDQIVVLAVWVALTTGALLWYLQRTIAVTGRQLYPVLPVIALGLSAGWGAWTPGRWRKRLAMVIAGLMLVFAVGAWAGALIPAYLPSPRLRPEEVDQTIEHRLDWQMGDVVTLLGYGISPSVARAGEQVTVTLYWQPVRTPERNYTVFVHLWGKGNELAGGRDTYPGLGNDPTIYWNPGEIIADAIPVPVAPEAAGPILLDVEAGLYNLEADERLPIRDAAGNPIGYPILGTVKLLSDQQPPGQPAYLLGAEFEGGLVLEGYDLSATALDPGSVLTLTLYWAPNGPLAVDYTTFVHLVDRAGQIVGQGDGPPCGGRYPTTAWGTGERFADSYEIVLPADVVPGGHSLLVGLYDPRTGERLLLVGGGDYLKLGPAIVVR